MNKLILSVLGAACFCVTGVAQEHKTALAVWSSTAYVSNNSVIVAPYFKGDGSLLTGVSASGMTLASNKVFIGNGVGAAEAQSVSGDIGITTAGVVSITAGVITNDDINASAAIATTKIAGEALVKTTVLTGEVAGVWNALTIVPGIITNGDIGANASIAPSKLAGGGSYVITNVGVASTSLLYFSYGILTNASAIP